MYTYNIFYVENQNQVGVVICVHKQDKNCILYFAVNKYFPFPLGVSNTGQTSSKSVTEYFLQGIHELVEDSNAHEYCGAGRGKYHMKIKGKTILIGRSSNGKFHQEGNSGPGPQRIILNVQERKGGRFQGEKIIIQRKYKGIKVQISFRNSK